MEDQIWRGCASLAAAFFGALREEEGVVVEVEVEESSEAAK